MKRSSLIFHSLLLSMVLMLSGCFLKSVHPLFTIEDAVILQNLDGVYEDEDQRWIFASDQNPQMVAELIRQYPSEDITIDPGDEDSLGIPGYLILHKDLSHPDRLPVLFIGMVGKISGHYYLNLKLFDMDLGMGSNLLEIHKFNVNTFSRIRLTNDQLYIEHLESNWISEQIVNNRVRIKHELVRSDYDDSSEILVTASTKELQQFIRKYGNEPEAYQKPDILIRVSDESP